MALAGYGCHVVIMVSALLLTEIEAASFLFLLPRHMTNSVHMVAGARDGSYFGVCPGGRVPGEALPCLAMLTSTGSQPDAPALALADRKCRR